MEAVDGNYRSDSFQLGLAENKRENGDKKIDVDNSQDELTIRVDTASQAYATVKWLAIEFLYPQSLNGTQQFVTVSLSDLTYTVSTTVLITVSSVKVPFSRDLPIVTMNQGSTVERFINLDDYFDDPDDSVLSYGSVSQYVEVTINANHTVDFEAPADWWGINQVIFTAENDDGARCEEVMTVEVIHVNQPPSLEGSSGVWPQPVRQISR